MLFDSSRGLKQDCYKQQTTPKIQSLHYNPLSKSDSICDILLDSATIWEPTKFIEEPNFHSTEIETVTTTIFAKHTTVDYILK